MRVLVDTSVWSLALRRNQPADSPEVTELIELISEVRCQMIGPVRQELLSGIKNQIHLRAFPDLEVTTRDYETAAEFFNLCRGKGVQGSNTDFLICVIAVLALTLALSTLVFVAVEIEKMVKRRRG